MALLFEDDKRRLVCECGNCRINKTDVFTYLKATNNKEDILEEHLIETELRCDKCKKIVKVIKPGKTKVLS